MICRDHTVWNLIDPDAPRLYHIYDDPFEERDLAGEHPEIVAALVATLIDPQIDQLAASVQVATRS